MVKFPKTTHVPEKNKVFEGIVNGLIICIPIWLVIAYLIWRW